MATETTTNPWATGTATEPAQDTASNPWATAEESGSSAPAEAANNPWSGTPDEGTETTGNAEPALDWLAADNAQGEAGFSILDPFVHYEIPLQDWVETGLSWLVDNFRGVFQSIRMPVDAVLTGVESTLTAAPAVLIITIMALLAWQLSSKRLAVGTILSLVAVGLIGAWHEAMITLALVLTSLIFCIGIGLPTGIWLARNDRVAAIMRPVLDAMQTTPPFVYLVPIVMLFGIGNVPGVVVTIVFALPPLIRLTNLGIRQVPADLVEASRSFGASPRQLLFKVQLPLAMPTIMAGINQTLMLALSMVVIASMIAVGGLGQMVLRGIGRLDMGLATVGGLGIVLLAILLDRMTQALGRDQRVSGVRHWHQRGPAGLITRLVGHRRSTDAGVPTGTAQQ
ncbi:glycine betaine/L-proline ABC transporter permease ProW [Marinobacter sp. X15-166B]|uniref:glycine betaine/L-proline ABC transporter permease ProW n=1 Tax=Marinobacter sp. X15-166B TaxID=1897620 RepID=UPI00085CC61D|nr:glycine betaine/L-proline ABC transporter permease ProW [Marinobacter sp. X15-166B]OEY66368.1 glycine/betaine ABC transporter permease [Marinobacter sp. X15-166B]